MNDTAAVRTHQASADEPATRAIRVLFRGEWSGRGRGLLAADPRVRTLCKVLVTYPDVRHIVPHLVSLDATTERRVLETVARFLERQHWLVTSVAIE